MTMPTCFLRPPCLLPVRPLPLAAVCPRRVAPARFRPRACASAPRQQQEQDQEQDQQDRRVDQPSSEPGAPVAASAAATNLGLDDEDEQQTRRVRIAEARLEAERLELLAAQAALASERAQLVAERKRLELDTLKAKREAALAHPGQPTGEGLPGTAPSDTSATRTNTAKESKGKGPAPISGQMLSDLLGVDFPRLSEEDITTLKDKVCTLSTFFVTHVDRSPFDERVVFRGNLRVPSAEAIDDLEAAAEREGLKDRVRLFILMDPKHPDTEGDGEKPVIVALPAAALPNQSTVPATILSIVTALATIFTALSYGVGIFGLNPMFLNKIATETLETQQALYTLPISVGALAIVLAHEIAHRVAAASHNIKLGLPVFLPSLQVGTYGTITPLQSYPRNRTGLFDVAASGPLIGASVSLVTLIAGLFLTSTGDVADWFPQIPSTLFNGSLLVGLLGNLILPPGFREQATLAVHPLLVVGYTGLLVNALNLIPIGRLDGGRIVQALYGRVMAARISGVTFVLQGIATIVGNSSLLLFWSLVCIFLQREGEYPCQDEVTEPSNKRFATGLGLILLMILVLTPIPEQFSRL